MFFFVALLSVLLALAGIALFRYFHLLDKPGNDLKNTRKPVPTLQGIVVYVITVLILAFFYPQLFSSSLGLGFLVGGTLIVLFEILAELEYLGKISRKIPPWSRFLVQMGASFLALWLSGVANYELLFFSQVLVLPNWLLYLAFACWSVFVINAVNWIDGTSAQGNGVLTIGFFTIFALIQWVVLPSYTEYTNLDALIFVQHLSLFLSFLSLVYTVIEYKPFALIRDVGTMFLAFALAYLSVIGGAKIGTIIVALSLVVFDALWVGLYRMFVIKKNPMKGDYTHLHHRLRRLGWTRGEVRVFVWVFSFLMMVLMLIQGTNRMNKLIIFLLMAGLFFGINTYLFIIKKLPCGLDAQKEA